MATERTSGQEGRGLLMPSFLSPPLIQACHDVGISHLLASSLINPKFTTHNPSLSSNTNHFVILIARLHPTNGTIRTRA